MTYAVKTYATAPATPAQVREHYKSLGLKVKISRAGNVRYRDQDCIAGSYWQDGRWINEYRATEVGIVLL